MPALPSFLLRVVRHAMVAGLLAAVCPTGHASAAPVRVVCAEHVWCAIAAEIGGADVTTTSILTSPAVDPHDFAPSPGVARAFAAADVIVLNAGGFDRWADGLVPEGAGVIRVADLPGMAHGETHLFYDPEAASAFGMAFARRLQDLRLADWDGIALRARIFADQVATVRTAIARARPQTAGVAVASLEPVGAPLLHALGFREVAADYARAVMNGTEPPPVQAAALEDEIASRTVRVLVINAAFDDPTARRYADAARTHGVAVVSLSEALPEGKDWTQWMKASIAALQSAASAVVP